LNACHGLRGHIVGFQLSFVAGDLRVQLARRVEKFRKELNAKDPSLKHQASTSPCPVDVQFKMVSQPNLF